MGGLMEAVFSGLVVELAGLKLKNPVMTASGTFGYGEEYAKDVDLNRLGAVIVKGLSLRPREGNPPPRIAETAAGLLNAIGLQNVGVKAFLEDKLPKLRRYDVPVIANVFGESIDEYKQVSEILTESRGIAALELNISCPNVKRGGLAFGTDPETAASVTREVKRVTDLPVFVKLSPNVGKLSEIAQGVEAAGADAISLINTITGMAVDVNTRRSKLSTLTGGLSGPAIKPIALRMVWEVVKSVRIPVIGIGGIMTAEDVLEFLIVGARAVQVGTANFVDPSITIKIIDRLEAYVKENGMNSIGEIIGTLEDE
jgi:dihydroorotate dehydrogenase (NAD+) catalytic subunit